MFDQPFCASIMAVESPVGPPPIMAVLPCTAAAAVVPLAAALSVADEHRRVERGASERGETAIKGERR